MARWFTGRRRTWPAPAAECRAACRGLCEDARVRTHVALLRGINVGTQTRIAMSDLREIVASLGHEDVATYIQSGNVVFTSPEADATRLADDLEAAISARVGLHP